MHEPSLFSASHFPPYKLMIPGPVEIDDDVIDALGRQSAAHYGPAWVELYSATQRLMQQALCTTHDVFLMFCSGTGALEAGIGGVLAPGERALVVVNGYFGQRLQSIARARGIETVVVTAPWGQAVDSADIAAALAADRTLAGVLVVHHETSTGVLNPVEAIAAVTRRFDVPLVVDAIASLGGERLLVDEWGIDICVGAPNKCLGAPVGLAPIAVSPRAWTLIDSKPNAVPGWYLNLRTWRQYAAEWGAWHPTPVTMSSQALEALYTALVQLHAEGVEARWERFRATAQAFRARLRALGFTPFVDGSAASSVISAVNAAPGMDVAEFIAFLAREHQIQIAGGLGATRGAIFRVGHMGHAGLPAYTDAFFAGLAQFMAATRA